MGLSRREYAARRGVSDKAVRKALGSKAAPGRIWKALLSDDTIDADLADRLWEANTNPAFRRGKEAERALASMAARGADLDADPADPEVRTPEVGSAPPPSSGPRLAVHNVTSLDQHMRTNRAKREPRPSDGASEVTGDLLDLAIQEKAEAVRRKRRENDIAEGVLVPAVAVEKHFVDLLRASTESWQTWPDKVGAEGAAKFGVDDEFAFVRWLKDAVRLELTQQSEDRNRVDAGD